MLLSILSSAAVGPTPDDGPVNAARPRGMGARQIL